MNNRAAFRKLADQIRLKKSKKHRADEPVEYKSLAERGWKKIGRPCPDGINGIWRHLAKTMSKARVMARILLSPPVPDEEYERRMKICHICPHVAIKTNDDHFCVCCGCPSFAYAKLEKKNRFSLHMCTASSPQFEEYK